MAKNILLIRNLSFVLLILSLVGAHGAKVHAAPSVRLNSCGYFDDGLGGGVNCECEPFGCLVGDGDGFCFQDGCDSCDTESFCGDWYSRCSGFCSFFAGVDYASCDGGSCSGACVCN